MPSLVSWNDSFSVLRKRWGRVPCDGKMQLNTNDLLKMPDDQLLDTWKSVVQRDTTGEGYEVRGWYHDIYKRELKGKEVLDVGSGFGIDGISFLMNGAKVTFCDIVESNLKVIERLCALNGLVASVCYLKDLKALDSLGAFDVIWCQGSLINAPSDIVKEERHKLVSHLKVGGHWIELAYPKSRWERDGKPPFRIWGEITDGRGTPWMEWYDLQKLLSCLGSPFKVVRSLEFHNSDFNWFDLVKL